MKKPTIFVTNDDGYNAPGLKNLVEFVRPFGDVFIVAPEHPKSGTGHAVTVRDPLRLRKVHSENGLEKYICNGTPVDCIKLGEQIVLGRKPDLLVSGINHGSNAAVNIVYSGTMAAVLESAIGGVPSVGFSLLDYRMDADFSVCEKYVKAIVKKVLTDGMPGDICLNVNIPAVNGDQIKGIRICKQAKSRWIEKYDHRKDPGNRDYYWLSGVFDLLDESEETDEWALRNNYVSVVPVQFDFTAHHAISEIKTWKLDA